VVARGWGIPAVVGLAGLVIERDAIEVGGRRLAVGEAISIDGGSGTVHLGVIAAERHVAPELETLLEWARALGIALEDEAESRSDTRAATAPRGESTIDRPAHAGDTRDALDDALLHALALKGAAAVEALAAAVDTEATALPARLEALVARGLLVAAKPLGFRLTDSGRTQAEARLERDRATFGHDSARTALLAFQPFDPRMKQSVTDWQLRPQGAELVPNDHADPRWDADVLARIGAIVEEATAWLDVLADRLPRLRCYSKRLRRALDAIRAGDGRFVASPRVDSVHGVWFELHEDLIRLAGSTRATESAAGRAS
jgi:pyruvate,orthophosphate dikinase